MTKTIKRIKRAIATSMTLGVGGMIGGQLESMGAPAGSFGGLSLGNVLPTLDMAGGVLDELNGMKPRHHKRKRR